MMTQQAKCGSVSYRNAETTDPARLPLVASLPLHVEMTSNTLSRRYELMVHEIVYVREFRELFDYYSYY
jgi:hypothetical protein